MLATGSDENSAVISELYHVTGDAADGAVLPYESKTGYSLSDGSVSLLLETGASAAARNATRYCRVLGYGMAHAPVPYGTVKGSEKGLVDAVNAALADAELTAGDIDAAVGFANGCAEVDGIERAGLSAVFGESLPVITVKERVGEGRAATAALSLAHAALLLHRDLENEPDAYTNGKKTGVTGGSLSRVLVISYAPGGSYTAVVLGK